MKLFIGLIIGFLILLPGCNRAKQIKCPDFSVDRLSRIDTFFNDKIENKELAGVVTLVAKNGRIQHFKSFGYLDTDSLKPMKNDVIIPIGSMTKIITSIAVLILYEDGKILLNDPVEKYIPEFKNLTVLVSPDTLLTENLKTKPTIRDLLRNASGMVYSGGRTISDKLYREAGFRNWDKPLAEFIQTLAGIPLAFQPGEKYQYSYSHDVLGYLVEIISGETLDQFCKERIFNPLELENTDFYVPIEKSGQFSNLYVYRNDTLEINDKQDSSIYLQLPNAISGGGGWWSSYGGIVTTVSDFYTISDMLLNYGQYNNIRILSRKSVELMTTNHIGDLRGKGRGYGLGIGITTSIGDYGEVGSDNEVYWAGGPYNTFFWIDYKEKLIGILFTNTAPFGHLDMMSKFKVLTLQAIDK